MITEQISTFSAPLHAAHAEPTSVQAGGLPAYVTVAEAQELLGIPIGNRAKMRRLIRDGKIQLAPQPLGYRPRIELMEVERVLGHRVTLMQFATAQASLRARRDQYRVKRLPRLEGKAMEDVHTR